MYTNSSSPRAQGSAAPADPSLRTAGLHAGGAQSWLGVRLRLCGPAAGRAAGLLALPLNLLFPSGFSCSAASGFGHCAADT